MTQNSDATVNTETAQAVHDAFLELSRGDVVDFQAAFEPQTIHSVRDHGNGVWVDFYQWDDWPENPDYPIGSLFVAVPAENTVYEAPKTEINNGHGEIKLGRITGVTLRDVSDEYVSANLKAVLEWDLNEDALQLSPTVAEQIRQEKIEFSEQFRALVGWDMKQLTAPYYGPPNWNEDTIDNPNFMLSAHTDGTVSIYSPGNETAVGRIDMSQLTSELTEQVEEVVNTDIRDALLKSDPEFPFPDTDH